MGRNTLYSIISIILLLFLQGCKTKISLPVYGDITPNTEIQSKEDLNRLIEKYKITRLLFVTEDLMAVEMPAEFLSDLFFIIENNNIWHSYSNTLPRPLNLKNIKYIAVESDFQDYRLAVFRENNNQEQISAYQRIKREFSFVGAASMSNKSVNRYREGSKFRYPVSDSESDLLLVFKSGKEYLLPSKEFAKRLIFKNTHWEISGFTDEILTIIWQDFPQKNLKDVYLDIKNSSSVLCLFVDGLGENVLENARANNMSGYFDKFDFQPLRTIYPPRTKYAYYKVGNGVHLNQSKEKSKSVFNSLNFKNAFIIEEDKMFYSSKYPVILNTDINSNGTIDDEIYETALNKIKNIDLDFLFVHFHSIDDEAHLSGPYSLATMSNVSVVSRYVYELVNEWKGDFIIFSDHGLHPVGMEGYHGINRLEDMKAMVSYGFKGK